MQQQEYDVAIAGGGPAGTSMAIRLASAGFKVFLAEQKKFPREKLCGEFISPECFRHFKELCVAPEFDISNGTNIERTIFYSKKGKGVAIPSDWLGGPNSFALGLSRAKMDELLLRRAARAGVDVAEESSATDLIFDANVVAGMKVKQKTGTEMSVIAKITVDATGRARRLARRFEEEEKRSAARLVAFKTHLAHASAEPNVCEIYAYSGGYGGCNQVEDGLYNLCFITTSADTRRMGSDPEMLMRKIVAGNGRAADVLKTAEVVRPWLAVPIEGFGRGDLIPAAGMICVGDTAAFIDPFTGSGILMALESAKVASAVVAEGLTNRRDFRFIDDSYRERYEITFGSRLRLCSLLRFSAFVPAIAGAVISVLSTSSHLRRRIASSTRT